MTRHRICLSGAWDFMPLADPSPIQNLPQPQWESQKIQVPSSWRWMFDPQAAFQPYDLFGYPSHWNDSPAGLLHRTFEVQAHPGQCVWLVFQATLQCSIYFVNGHKIADSVESYLPIELDVTDAVQEGVNQLDVWCGPWKRIPTPTGEKVLVPSGSWFAALARGLWQDVFLEYRPEIWLEDVFIRTSTRQGKIEVELTIENRSQQAFQGQVKTHAVDGSSPVLEFLPLNVAIPAGEQQILQIEAPWTEAIRWSPENPHLYELETILRPYPLSLGDMGRGEAIDTKRTRFGFREVWLDGPNFILNGVRINLRGDAWHYQGFVQQSKEYALNWYRMCQQTGINFVRLHAMPYPVCYLEAADEFGMLIVDESAIYGSGKAIQADHPIFLQNCHAHLRALVRRDRNHPSVIIWSMQNEMRWVDGRDGYRDAIPALTAAIKALDPTRAVSYDGDNRLVPAEWCDIISMHYNIDGTVDSWARSKPAKPLIFGEHGPFHYISPQTCSQFGGPAAYLSYPACMESIGLRERLFIEYARRAGVTGQTPFNTVNYAMWALPEHVAPGVPAYALTINNGQLTDSPLFIPNPAWLHLAAGFKPVTALPNEYDHSFFGGDALSRSFSLYNDTEHPAQVRLEYRWLLADNLLEQGQIEMMQQPGERLEWQHTLDLPATVEKAELVLEMAVYHGGNRLHQGEFRYQVYPPALRVKPIGSGEGVAYLGTPAGFRAVSRWLPGARCLDSLDDLGTAPVLVLGLLDSRKAGDLRSNLEQFVAHGGSLLVLEQTQFTLGELAFSGRGFPIAFINDTAHPIFAGLSDADLCFWHPGNVNAPNVPGLVANAFHKPVNGDLKILLECGDGDFGWGGLLWSPMVEYAVGQGRAVFNQMEVTPNWEKVPPACLLLRNMLEYACKPTAAPRREAFLYASEAFPAREWIVQTGVNFTHAMLPKPGDLVILDPDDLDPHTLPVLTEYLRDGGDILVLPSEPRHQEALSQLAGVPVSLLEEQVYQVKATSHWLVRSISTYDLYHIERVTYTPGNYNNSIIARYALDIPGAEPLFENVQNPWVEFFVHGRDAEYHKIAMATMNHKTPFWPHIFGAILPVGRGFLVFNQLLLLPDNAKATRVYTRLLANLGVSIHTPLFAAVKQEQDYGIEMLMALPQEPYQDYNAMVAYFTDPGYVLNNLGEGVYGWMKRAEKSHGSVTISNSAGRTWFLTVFADSVINRDPSRRDTNVLPDPSLVPDLFVEVNCPCQVFVNGHRYANIPAALEEALKIEDVLLAQGINCLALICQAGEADIRINLWFKNKFGEPMTDLKYSLMVD